MELIADCIDARSANGVCYGTWSALAATLSPVSELGAEQELLGSRRNTDLTEDEVDALWAQACPASDSLVLYVPPSVAHNSPDGTGEE
jgi:hypothetical protein